MNTATVSSDSTLPDVIASDAITAHEVRSHLVPVDDCALLVGSGANVMLLNPAARREAEDGCLKVPAGFWDTVVVSPLPPAFGTSGRAPGRRLNITLFDRTVTLQIPVTHPIEHALIPWRFLCQESTETGECDLTIESLGSGYLGYVKNGTIEVLADSLALSIWITREVSGLLHNNSNWFATLHAAGVMYKGKLIAFPGLSHSGKSTLVASLCMAGHPYFAEDCLPIMDSSLRTAALPLAIKLRAPGWPFLRSRLTGFDHLPEDTEGSIPIKLWQPPSHDIRSAPIEAIVFPHFERGAAPEWRRLPLIEAVFDLISSESRPIHHTPDSWRQMIAALERIPIFEIRYGSIEDSHLLVETIARECR